MIGLTHLLIASLVCSLAQSSPMTDLATSLLMGSAPSEVTYASSLSEEYELSLPKAITRRIVSSGLRQDLDGSVKAAEELLHDPSREKLTNSKKMKLARFYAALELYSSLTEVLDQCNYDAYIKLAKNYRAASEAQLKRDGLIFGSIIEAIKIHGQNCRPKYLNNFRKQYREIEATGLMSRIDLILDDSELIKTIFSSEDLLWVLKNRYFLAGFKSAKEILSFKLAHIGQINQASVRRYLIEPCNEFVKQLSDIFYPAQLDLALDETKLIEIDPENDLTFKKTWIKFKLCDGLSRNSRTVEYELSH